MSNEEDNGKYIFACSCREDGQAEIEEVRQWAEKILEVKRENLFSGILYYLELQYGMSDYQIAADQWGGISVSIAPNIAKYVEPYDDFVQCDMFEDGFLYIFKRAYDKFGERDLVKEMLNNEGWKNDHSKAP